VNALALLLAAAAAGYGVARATGLPAIPLLVLAGVLLSAVADVPAEFLENAVVLGSAFLVFVAGTEMNPARIGYQRRAVLRVGAAHFLLLGLAGFGVARLLGFPSHTSAYLALALTASSTLVVVRMLQARGQLFEPFARLVIGVLLLQDVLVILLIPLLTRLGSGLDAVLAGVTATSLLLMGAYLCLRWIAPAVVLRLGRNEEGLLLVVLGALFAFLGAANLLGLPLVAGAFLAGVGLSAFPVSGLVRGQVQPLADFFSALFFTALGAFLVIPTLEESLQAAVFSVLVMALTPPLVAFVAERAGFSARPAIFSGLLLSQASEFSLVVGLQGVAFGQLDPGVFTIITLVTVVTMVLTPLLATDRATLALMHLHPTRRVRTAERPVPEGHVLLIGCGANGMPLLETLVIGPYRVVAVDDDPTVVARVQEAGIECIRGDAADAEVLRRAGADRARVVISTIRRPRDNAPLLGLAPDVPVIVRGFSEDDARWIREQGGKPILYSEAAAADFLSWYEEQQGS
jgi:Kef-type K+ transport system membrane component KefB